MREIGASQPNQTMAAIVETTAQPFLVVDGDFRVEFANRAFLESFQVTREETLRRNLFDLGNGQWNIEKLRRMLAEVLPAPSSICGFRVEHDFESLGRRVMLLNARRLRKSESNSERILISIDDVTEREALKTELAGRAEFSEKLVESLSEMVLVLRSDMTVLSANHSFHKTFGTTPEQIAGVAFGRIMNGCWDDPDLRRMLEDVLPRQHAFDAYEVDCDFGHAGRRIMLVNGRRLDHMPLILLTIRDVTEERLNEARQAAIVGETQHRVKNIFTNVMALAHLSSKYAETSKEFIGSFEERLKSLARTHDLLVDGPNEGADIGEIIRSELTALGATKDRHFRLEGPEVRLRGEETHAFAMAVHELGTNALKYGALKSTTGRIAISWRQLAEESDARIEFVWEEIGAQIDSAVESKGGFGTEMLNSIVPYMLHGEANQEFTPTGLTYSLNFPAEHE